MLHSKYYKKETKEDPKTSAIFENLMLLPDNVFWHLLKSACFNGNELPKHSGNLYDYTFWPHWNSNGTRNKNFVEPDLFLQFDEFDVIIEVKYGEIKGQYQDQWKQEIIAYQNEYQENKPFIFIAVGGNETAQKESMNIGKENIPIYKCNWLSLFYSVDKYLKELDKITISDYYISATRRILNNILLAFNLNGVYNIHWFNTLADSHTVISFSSIENISNFFNNKEL